MVQNFIPILIPHMGEGIREAIVIQFLKQPGDLVKEGEALFEVETEKMTGPVEAPCDGVLNEWRVRAGTVLAIGGEVGSIRLGGYGQEPTTAPSSLVSDLMTSTAEAPAAGLLRNDRLAPRTRKMLVEHGLLDQVDQIPRQGEKLLPDDIERFIAARKVAPVPTPVTGIRKLTTPERWQAHRFECITPGGIPATLSVRVAWAKLESFLEQLKIEPGAQSLEATVLMAWCVARAMSAHPMVRTRLYSENECLTYEPGAIGIAAATPNQTLAVTSIPCPGLGDWARFHDAAVNGLELAITGKNQVSPETTVILSNMMPYRIYHAVPAVIAPAVATIFAGDVSWMATGKGPHPEFSRMFYLTMTFDHRLIGGVAAAQFLHDIANEMETCDRLQTKTLASPASEVDFIPQVADRLRQLVADLQGVPPSLVELGIRFSDLPKDSLGFVNAELVAERLQEFVRSNYPDAPLSLEEVKNKSLLEIAEALAHKNGQKL